ncbi:uncharacterized protein LOC117434138 isoform X1 [Acipenser ruthenus]|uniref:uncharacterized protein LOC117434138 isoform X1 n=1 Tax=Acipenser ruthenus TaxID=7906 RepID=UPI0027418C94|nr:uncharacterized protein LOC117434138 isoform X1 [Acipenser ruthenus]
MIIPQVLLLMICTSSPKAEVHAITKKVHQGENVTLQCDVRHGQETSWCRQHPEQVPVVIFQDALNIRSSEPDPEYHDGFGPRFSSVLNRTTWTVNLKIENISEWDFALYFCTVRVKGDIRFGNSTHLVSAEDTGESVPLPLCWTLLGTSLFVTAISCVAFCGFHIFQQERVKSKPSATRKSNRHESDYQARAANVDLESEYQELTHKDSALYAVCVKKEQPRRD